MRIQVLGSGSSGNCYAIHGAASSLLLECGVRFRDIQEGLEHRVTRLAGCLISHEHGDHVKSVKDLMKVGVDVYASQGTIDALQLFGHRVHALAALRQHTIDGWTVLPFDAVHDAAEPLCFLIASTEGKLLYLTDTAYCRYRFEGLTHIMLEANYAPEILRANAEHGEIPFPRRRRLLRNHMSVERAIDLLRANDLSQVQEIHLLHLSDSNSDADAFRQVVAEATGKPVYVAPRKCRE